MSTYFNLLDQACLFEILVKLPYLDLQIMLEVYPRLKTITSDNRYFSDNWKKQNIIVITGTVERGWGAIANKYEVEVDTSNGLKHGLYTEYDSDIDLVWMRRYYRQNILNGLETTYNKRNKLRSQVNWVNGKKQGVEQKWDKHGNIKATSPYVDNWCEGQAWIYKEGERSLTEFHHDHVHGKSIEWFDNGQRKSEGNYRNGLSHGRFIEWSPTGVIHSIAIYSHGTLIIPHKFWGSDGNPR
jgi:antitoxin component YwqK of YwqJK toxin-antitoxin module